MERYTYTAFISYRHTLSDEAVAKKLHTLIENYSIPGDIKKSSGRKKMGRVFRDQEELPLSTDLGGDIKAALENSEWLIVLCSPEYLKSRWCMTEIDYFISLGKRDHILAILVDGEPDEAFPYQLRFVEADGKTEEVEPLAGDVRAESLSGSLKKLDREKLRVIAPMLGVTYDKLRQRARRRKIRLAFSSGAVVIALLAGFLTYALFKNAEVSRQRDLALDNQMQVLIEQANISVAGSNKLPAKKMLAEAASLRETVGESNDDALYSALEAALYTSSFETVQTIDNDNRIFSSIIFSHNDKYLLGITNKNSATLIDAENGKLMYSVSRSDIGQLFSVGFTLDDKYFFTVDSQYGYVSLYKTETGELYREFNASNGTAGNIATEAFALEGNKILVPMRHFLAVWDIEADTAEEILPTSDEVFDTYTQLYMLDISPDRKSLAVGSPGYGLELEIKALDGSGAVKLENDSQRAYYPITFSGNGKYVSATSFGVYSVWSADTGKQIRLGTYNNTMSGIDSSALNYDGSILMIMTPRYLAAIDVESGEVLWEKTSESNSETEAKISPNGKYVCASGGISGVFDIKTGEVLSSLPCTAFSNDGMKVLCDSHSSTPTLLTTPEGATAKLVDSFDGELFTTERYTNPSKNIGVNLRYMCSDIYTTPTEAARRKTFFYISPDTAYGAYTHYDGFIEVFDISDPDDIKAAYCVAEHCFNAVTDLLFNGKIMASCGGYDARCALFDLEHGTMLHVLKCSDFAHKCEFSKDGSKIIILCGKYEDTALVYSVKTGNLIYSFTAPEGEKFTNIGFTEDGTQAVAIISDGRADVGELYPTFDKMIEMTK